MTLTKYDTFISYNRNDKLLVEALVRRLRAEGVTAWIDVFNLVPGEPWQPKVEQALESCASCCVFVGPAGLTPWQKEETQAAIERRVKTRNVFRVIPIILPGVSARIRNKLPKFLTAVTWIEFRDSIEDEESFRRLAHGIRGTAAAPPPFDPTETGQPHWPSGVGPRDLSWARAALSSDSAVRFLFGVLQPSPSRHARLCHYVAALIEKYSWLPAPCFSPAERPFVDKARQVLIDKGCLFAPPAQLDAGPKNALNLLVTAGAELPESFPVPDFWVGVAPPTTEPKEETRFYSCEVNLALVCILLHCADEAGLTDELLKDLLCLPKNVRPDVLLLVMLLWPEVVASSYEFLQLPNVQEVSRAGLSILFTGDGVARGTDGPMMHPALARAIEALRRRDFATARELRQELSASAATDGDPAAETALAYVDVAISLAEGNNAAAERTLYEMFGRFADPEVGLNLALLLCWYGQHGEARDVLQRLETAALPAAQSPLSQIVNCWAAHHAAPRNTNGHQRALEELMAALGRSADSPALLWHILSAACLDMGLVDAAIECAEKATRKDPRPLEYRIQQATALLHRFPATPPDYQRREPFPVRAREPTYASILLKSVLAEAGERRGGRFAGTVNHLLGIAYYCAAVATPEQRERMSLFAQAGAAFSKAHEMTGSDSHHLAGYAGQAHLRAREFRRACDIFASIPPDARSKSSETAFIVALALDDRLDEAISEVTSALERGGLSAEAIANVAMLVLQCGLPEDAKRLLRLAAGGLERSSWMLHFLLGRAHIDLGEFEDAEQELWRAISLNSTEPRLYSAHLPAFEQCVFLRMRALLSDARRRADVVKADTGFLDEFEQRVGREVDSYREHVEGLSQFPATASTVIAKSLEPIRRAVDELRRIVTLLAKLLQDPEAREAEVFLATARRLLGGAQGGRPAPVEAHAPIPQAIGGEPWVELQRALSGARPWAKAGLKLDDSGADIWAQVVDATPRPVVSHWLNLAARQFDVEARGKNLRAYSVTKGVERKPYQEAVVLRAKLRNYGRIILADEVGLGKTIEACLIFSEYSQRGLIKSCLILVPSRELGQQWEHELTEKFSLSRGRGKGLGRYRAPGWAGFDGHSVCILTYQAAVANASAVAGRRWDMVICDEAHHLTNRGSARFRLIKALSKSPYLLLLTATPIQRRVDDLYSLAQLIRPSIFPTLKAFRERYGDPRNPRTILNAEDLARRMHEIMVRNRAGAVSSEVLFGRRRFNDLTVTLDSDERDFYERVEAIVFKAYKHRESGKPPLAYYSLARAASSSPMAALHWLESLAGEPSVAAEARKLLDFARHLKPASKLRELKKLLALLSEKERVIVFTDYRSTARSIADTVGGFQIDSHLTDHQLGERLEAFRSGREGRILVATPRLSEGLNLQFCRHVVNFDLPWNPFRIEQRIGRVHRVGQRSPEVFISTLSAYDTIEQLIKEFLQSKLRMFEEVVGRMTHQIFEFESRGTIEEQIKEVLARVESRRQLKRELARDSFDQPILTHDPELKKPPKNENLTLVFDHAWQRYTEPDDDDD